MLVCLFLGAGWEQQQEDHNAVLQRHAAQLCPAHTALPNRPTHSHLNLFCPFCRCPPPQVDNNVSKSQHLLDAVAASQRVFKSAYGYAEWRRACEVGEVAAVEQWRQWQPCCRGTLPCLVCFFALHICPPCTQPLHTHPLLRYHPSTAAPAPAAAYLPACLPAQGSCTGIKASARTYRELRDNLGEGLRFYMGLQEAIGSLRQQAGDHVMTRRIQRCDHTPARLPACGGTEEAGCAVRQWLPCLLACSPVLCCWCESRAKYFS